MFSVTKITKSKRFVARCFLIFIATLIVGFFLTVCCRAEEKIVIEYNGKLALCEVQKTFLQSPTKWEIPLEEVEKMVLEKGFVYEKKEIKVRFLFWGYFIPKIETTTTTNFYAFDVDFADGKGKFWEPKEKKVVVDFENSYWLLLWPLILLLISGIFVFRILVNFEMKIEGIYAGLFRLEVFYLFFYLSWMFLCKSIIFRTLKQNGVALMWLIPTLVSFFVLFRAGKGLSSCCQDDLLGIISSVTLAVILLGGIFIIYDCFTNLYYSIFVVNIIPIGILIKSFIVSFRKEISTKGISP
ncbi:MAG: hypothetical protein V1851_02510 [Patescibacteria group bacterium]